VCASPGKKSSCCFRVFTLNAQNLEGWRSDMTSAIHCVGLTKSFGELKAIDAIGFDIARGEICSILGPNGAGKSTLIAMLSGLLKPDAGSVCVAGLKPLANRSEFRLCIGVVPDNLSLLSELTIEEHLEMSGPIYGLDRSTTRRRSGDLRRLFNLYDKRRTFARECSHGMRKKTALALAMLHNPAVLMLDEPFEGIDPASAESIRQLLHSIARRGVAILLTSHILPLVDRTSDRIMLMRGGHLLWDSRESGLPESAEKLYFELVEQASQGDIEWLQSRLS
jgi:ABC-2 type transport system ATP-binding protein